MIFKKLPILLITIGFLSSCSIDINAAQNSKGFDGFNSQSFEMIQANNKLITETRNVSNFDKISVRNAIKVVIVDQKFDNKISLQGPDNILKYLKSEVKDGQLILSFTKSVSFKNQDLTITIPHQKIRAIDISGASKIEAKHNMKVEKFSANVSGASKAVFSLTANELNLKISGASVADISGNAQKLVAVVSGASKLKSNQMKVSNVDVDCSGASKAEIWAVDNLKANASGASKVVYENQSGLHKKLSDSGASSIKSN